MKPLQESQVEISRGKIIDSNNVDSKVPTGQGVWRYVIVPDGTCIRKHQELISLDLSEFLVVPVVRKSGQLDYKPTGP